VYGISKGKLIGCPVLAFHKLKNLPNHDRSSILSFRVFHIFADNASDVDVDDRLFITDGIVGLFLMYEGSDVSVSLQLDCTCVPPELSQSNIMK
jgi:hypothetical protein